MGRAGQRRFGIALAGTLGLVSAGSTGLAQDGAGLRFTYGIDSRLFLHSNATLSPTEEDASFESNTRLFFGVSSVTPQSYFTADAGGRLRYITLLDGGESTLRNGFVSPDLRLGWGRDSAASRIDTSAFWRETDLAEDRNIDDFDGLEGRRQESGGTIAYRWGEDRRWGFGLRASVIDTTFIDAPGETDRRRDLLGADLRLDLSETTQLTFDLAHVRFEEAGEDPRYSTRLAADVSIAQPNGSYVFGLTAEDTEDGTRTGLTFGRALDLPTGSLSARIGATRGTDGDLSLTGTLDWSHALPDGEITASLSRGVAADDATDAETQTTSVSLGLTKEINERMVLTADFGYAESRETDTDEVTRNGAAGLMLSYDVGQDWLLDAGIRHRMRDDPDEPSAADNAIFLGLRKTFERQY